MTRLLSILVLLTCLRVGGANRYIDNTATGANDGTSWANAWTKLESISWTAGNTYYISGGASSQTYTGSVVFGTSGTAGNRITFSVSDDAGKNGAVLIDGQNLEGAGGVLSINTRDFITVIGGTGTAPTNNFQVDTGSTKITDNIRLWFVNVKAAAGANSAAGIYLAGTPNDITIQHVGVTNVTRNGTDAEPAYGVWLNMTGAGAISNLLFQNLYISHTDDDGFQSVGNDPSDLIKAEVSHCWIEYVGDDGLEVNHGWSIHDNIIWKARFLHGHPDGIQSNGSAFRIYNNRFGDFFNSCIRAQSSSLTNWHDFWCYNNLFIPRAGPGVGLPYTPLTNVVFEIAQYAIGPGGELALQTWSNIYVMNNTIYLTNCAIGGGNISWNKRQTDFFFDNVILTNCAFMNNLFVTRLPDRNLNNGGGISWQDWKTGAPWGNLPTYLNEQANVCDWNTIASDGLGVGQKAITYFGGDYATGEAMAGSSIWTHNKSTMPIFVSEGVDFDLRGTDMAALKNGTNLSALFSIDILNRSRSASGAWSRGAFDPQDIIVHLDFEDPLDSADVITNRSGLGNHAWRLGYQGSPAGSNFPNRAAVTVSPGTNTSTYCGNFNWYTDGHGDYDRSGDYAGVTNAIRLTNMTTATIMVRARYRAVYSNDYTLDHEATLLSGGLAVTTLGTWGFGRWPQEVEGNGTRFNIRTNVNTSTPQNGSAGNMFFGKAGALVCQFPIDQYAPINDGNTTNWNHYAITWSSGIVTLYQNGLPVGTNDASAATTTLTLGGGWMCVGCNTHNSDKPYLDDADQFPNNGFMNGLIDDVFIFDRALSASEVLAYSGYDAPAGGGGAPGGGNGASARAKLRGLRL